MFFQEDNWINGISLYYSTEEDELRQPYLYKDDFFEKNIVGFEDIQSVISVNIALRRQVSNDIWDNCDAHLHSRRCRMVSTLGDIPWNWRRFYFYNGNKLIFGQKFLGLSLTTKLNEVLPFLSKETMFSAKKTDWLSDQYFLIRIKAFRLACTTFYAQNNKYIALRNCGITRILSDGEHG